MHTKIQLVAELLDLLGGAYSTPSDSLAGLGAWDSPWGMGWEGKRANGREGKRKGGE